MDVFRYNTYKNVGPKRMRRFQTIMECWKHLPLNIIIDMYFLDQNQLLSTLEDDWSALLKSVKNREEIHLQLLQHNRQVLLRDRKTDDQQQRDAQIVKLRSVLNKIINENKAIESEVRQINEKYQNSSTSAQEIVKVMTIVASKVNQITQKALDKSRTFDSSLEDKHSRMKRNLVGMLGQRQKLNLQHFHNVIFDYSHSKVQTEILKMERLLKSLEDKEYDRLNEVYNPKQKPRIGSVERIREVAVARRRQYSLSKEERSSAKRSEHSKKQKNKILCELYGIMVLSKYQFVEDYSGHSEERKQRLFNDLMTKNKKNHSHIVSFRENESKFEDKIKSFQNILQSQEKQIPEEEIRQIADGLIKGPEEKLKQKMHYQNHSFSEPISNKIKPKTKNVHNETISFREFLATEADTYRKQQDQQESDKPKNKLFGTRGKTIPKESEDFPHIFNKTLASNQNQGRFEPIRKQIRFEGNKGKLPDIYRKSSLDGKTVGRLSKLAISKGSFKEDLNNMEEEILKTNKKIEKSFRDDKMQSQRTKMILKNVEVGIPPMNPRREDWLKREETTIVRERKKTDSLMGDTAYCKRTLTKFFDGKLNGIN